MPPFLAKRLFDCASEHLSKTPFHWESGESVGTIYAHASEVLRNTDGKWYISHAGWEHGGLSLAPLLWHDGLDQEDASLPPAD